MRLNVRAKLVAIVGASAAAFVVLIVTGAMLASSVTQKLDSIRDRYVPRAELEPQLQAQLEQLRRALQDAVAARDVDALDATRDLREAFVDRLVAAHGVVDPADALALRKAVEDYHADAVELSRRMIAGESGEEIVEAMAAMQAKQTHAKELLHRTTTFDRNELTAAFAAASSAQQTASRLRLWVGVACLLVVAAISLWLGRGLVDAVAELTAGFARFGNGDFAKPIRVVRHDELGEVAENANRMAENLTKLAKERDRTDWIRTGVAGLAQELRGELEPEEAARRAARFLARHVDAPAAALYYANRSKVFRLLGQYSLSPSESDGSLAPSFRAGEGLVGEAVLQDEIRVVNDPPSDYLRIRSGLGEATPKAIVLLPLVHAGKVRGVLELALFRPWAEEARELLVLVRESLAIALEVALARTATRELLAETQRQAARLTAQEEELQSTNEELQAQQEELRQTNDELTQQAEELEQQRRALEEKNRELDEVRLGLETKAEELTKVSAYKSQFLANMSHELRTPLNSMLLLSNLLVENEGGNLTSKQVEFCRTIHSAGKDLLALINQVLDIARVEAGKQRVQIERVELETLKDQAERVFGPLATDQGLSFSATLDAALPGAISTDAQKVQQILTNLLANAIKFTQQGEVSLRVCPAAPSTTFQRGDLSAANAIAFEVADTGIGIAPEHLERIFVPFEQVDGSSDRRYGGSGLGLSIARELAQLLGGELQVESSPGKGSRFVCYLPREREGGVADAPPPSLVAQAPPVQPKIQANGSAKKSADPYLLIIEDDPVFAAALGDVVRAQGLRSVWAADGPTGLARAREERPHGIVLDVKLPEVDGWKVMEELRADPATSDIPVHFISAVDGVERGMAMGAMGYLTKPATVSDLVRVVESLAPKSTERPCRILVVEEASLGDSVVRQLTAENLDARRVSSAAEALEAVSKERFACVILDLSLPDMDGLELLRSLEEKCGAEMPAVVVYTARALSKIEAQRLEAYAEAVVLKEGLSVERVVDEVRLFVRRLKEGLGPRRASASFAGSKGVRLEGRKVLVADDDMRTVYALSATLRAKGAEVFVADTGRAALSTLGEHPEIEAVLMDIMMPEMDGYEAIRRIRQDGRFRDLPVIALTAKAMKDDRDKCLQIGASDYLTKPIDPERLLSMLHSRLEARDHGA
jgi:CheY-like chemotaxis protein